MLATNVPIAAPIGPKTKTKVVAAMALETRSTSDATSKSRVRPAARRTTPYSATLWSNITVKMMRIGAPERY